MKITILTLFPKMMESFFSESIIKRAVEKKIVEIEIVNLRDFCINDYGTVDDRPYGGGAGMVLRVEPMSNALLKLKSNKSYTILTSARGKVYSQKKAIELSQKEHIIIIAGHYEGVDERITTLIDEEITIGDYVLTGGELPAGIIVDSLVRLIPQVLKKKEATEIESFFEVSLDELIKILPEKDLIKLKEKGVEKMRLLEYPQYTRPQTFEGLDVPEVLLTGDPKKIHEFQMKEAYLKTKKTRPDLLNING